MYLIHCHGILLTTASDQRMCLLVNEVKCWANAVEIHRSYHVTHQQKLGGPLER